MIREKLFTPRKAIEDFLEQPQVAALNNRIYASLLILREPDEGHGRCFRLQSPALNIFNEVYFQCTRILAERHPEDDFVSSYFDDARISLGSAYEAEIVFSIVYLMFSVMNDKTIKTERFRSTIENHLNPKSGYFVHFKSIADDYTMKGLSFDLSFTPIPINISNPAQLDWRSITHDFHPSLIDEAVQLGTTEDAQHSILDVIQSQYAIFVADTHLPPMDAIFESIRKVIACRFAEDVNPSRLEEAKSLNRAIASAQLGLEKEYDDLCDQFRQQSIELEALKKQNEKIFSKSLPRKIHLNTAFGYKTNFQRIIYCLCKLNFFLNEFDKPAYDVDVFSTMGIATQSDLVTGSKALSNSRGAAKIDCQNELAIFYEMTETYKKACKLV